MFSSSRNNNSKFISNFMNYSIKYRLTMAGLDSNKLIKFVYFGTNVLSG